MTVGTWPKHRVKCPIPWIRSRTNHPLFLPSYILTGLRQLTYYVQIEPDRGMFLMHLNMAAHSESIIVTFPIILLPSS